MVGPKPPFKPKHIRALRTGLQHEDRTHDLAVFETAIDSKLRGGDLVRLRVADIHTGDGIRLRPTIVQQETVRPVPFALHGDDPHDAGPVGKRRGLRVGDRLLPSRSRSGERLTARRYCRLVDDWVTLIGLDPAGYGTHGLLGTKVGLIGLSCCRFHEHPVSV